MTIEFNEQQVYTIYGIENWWRHSTKQTYEIAGSAGTGKTTIIRYFIKNIGLSLDEVLFVTFMGKAASQLSRNGLPGKTIHSAIYEFIKVPDRDENGRIVFNERGKIKMKPMFRKKDSIGKNIKLIIVDEAGMVDKKIALDLLSYGIPIIALGDLNQLPPPFGSPYFLKNPDSILTIPMRQKEGDPIIWLANQILNGQELKAGIYDKSMVINQDDLSDYHLTDASVILTETNLLRYNVNEFFRNNIRKIKRPEYPHIGEKIMCRQNDWSKCIDDGIYLTNGLFGFVDDVHKETFNGTKLELDFRPDFTDDYFRNVSIDYKHLYEKPGVVDDEYNLNDFQRKFLTKFEFAYAQTVHTSQGSQYKNVTYLNEKMMRSKEDQKKIEYTAITRAIDSVIFVLPKKKIYVPVNYDE